MVTTGADQPGTQLEGMRVDSDRLQGEEAVVLQGSDDNRLIGDICGPSDAPVAIVLARRRAEPVMLAQGNAPAWRRGLPGMHI